jgi:hypothetical protein
MWKQTTVTLASAKVLLQTHSDNSCMVRHFHTHACNYYRHHMIQNSLHCAFHFTPRASKFYGQERHPLFWAGSRVARGKTKISGTPNLNKFVIFIAHTQSINVTAGPHNTRQLQNVPVIYFWEVHNGTSLKLHFLQNSPLCKYAPLLVTVKVLETFLVLWKPFQLFLPILNYLSSITKALSLQFWFQSKEQVKISCSQMGMLHLVT